MKRPPYGRVPLKLRRFERRYDPQTGGYRAPGSGQPDYGSVELEVGRLWYSLVMLLQPQQVLETGTYYGYSTCMIAQALSDLGGERMVTTIDPDRKPHLWVGTRLAPRIEWIAARSQDAAKDLAGAAYDMLVLDSDHHYNTVMEELIAFEPMLRKGGVILMHDTLFFDGVGAAVKQLQRNPRFEVVTLDSPRTHGRPKHRRPGVTIVRKAKIKGPPLVFESQYDGLFDGNTVEPALLRGDRSPV